MSILIGKKIILRPLRKEDQALTLKWKNDLHLRNLTLGHPFPVTSGMEENWIQEIIARSNPGRAVFGIEVIESATLVGYTQLMNINWIHRTGSFGIIIGDSSWTGVGIGSETADLMIQYAFLQLNLRKINLEVTEVNTKAAQFYEGLGFKEEGRLREEVFLNGEWHALKLYGLLRSEYKSK